MNITYKKLWKLLIDKNMNKRDLKRVSGVSTTSIAKLSKGENITTDVLLKICKALNCGIYDIMDMEQNEPADKQSDA
ncbi:MAG: helix-turn-helix transcriptional regulator [Clostridiales Family XIII bacterium]|jgi:DNA-binding Xre family transcriptional regulator|nr:helix-turn-helix transcriptional regulator [Clostridiales Family XIII bacterium]